MIDKESKILIIDDEQDICHQLSGLLSDIGYISKTISMAAVLMGSLLGGLLLPRLRMFRALFMFGIVQMLSNLLFAWMCWRAGLAKSNLFMACHCSLLTRLVSLFQHCAVFMGL